MKYLPILFTSCTTVSNTALYGSGFASLLLLGALALFYLLIIKHNQNEKNKSKIEKREEAKSKRQADAAFELRTSLHEDKQGRDYKDFSLTEMI